MRFVIGVVTTLVPGRPVFPRSTVSGSTVVVEWDPPADGGTPTDYRLEAMSPGGATTTVLSGGLRRMTFTGIAAGLYLLRLQALNAAGAGSFTNYILIGVGVGLLTGDIVGTLLWSGPGDVDLHVEEPGGTRVSVGNPVGPTARLERGATGGPGPEIIRILPGLAAFGAYKFFAVCGSATSAVAAYFIVRLAADTASEAAQLFTSSICSGGPNPVVGYNLADVAVPSGAVTPTTGTRVPDARPTFAVRREP
ncbi:MAG: fibronectin type III domain-containing protein [Acidobacteriota bacterium]